MPAARDYFPWMPAGGKSFPNNSDTGPGLLVHNENQTGHETPERIKPFRKLNTQQVGVSSIHYGIARDPRAPNIRFGRPGEYSESVKLCMQEDGAAGVAAAMLEMAERNYASRKLEPLGHSAKPSTELPEYTKAENFTFGKPSGSSENTKTLIYFNGEAAPSSKSATSLHKNRGYDWAKAGIDPTQHRFGRSTFDSETCGTTKSLIEAEDTSKSTHLVPLPVLHSYSLSAQPLGASRNLGFGNRTQKSDFAYGKTMKGDEFGARMLMANCGEEPQEDEFLGKPITKNKIVMKCRREDAYHNATDDRIFGVPTVRTDIARPQHRKFDDANNYGDDSDAKSLLYPSGYTAAGVTDDQFYKNMTLDDIKIFFAKAEIDLADQQLQKAFALAKHSEKRCTLAAFRIALNDLGY